MSLLVIEDLTVQVAGEQILNGLSLTAFIPLFEALGDKRETFTIQFSREDRRILALALEHVQSQGKDLGLRVPEVPTRIGRELALAFLNATYKDLDYGLGRLDRWQLRTLVRWKLRINAGGHSPLSVVYLACMIVFPLYGLKLILHLMCVRLIAGSGYRAVRDIRRDLYQKAQRLPLSYFDREKTGMLMSRLINDVEVIAPVISSNLRDSITNIFYILTHFLLLAYLNFYLVLVSAIAVPLILSPVTLFARKILKSTTRSQEHFADLNALLQEAISGIRVIRSFGAEDYELSRFRHANHRLFWRMFKQQFYVQVEPENN